MEYFLFFSLAVFFLIFLLTLIIAVCEGTRTEKDIVEIALLTIMGLASFLGIAVTVYMFYMWYVEFVLA